MNNVYPFKSIHRNAEKFCEFMHFCRSEYISFCNQERNNGVEFGEWKNSNWFRSADPISAPHVLIRHHERGRYNGDAGGVNGAIRIFYRADSHHASEVISIFNKEDIIKILPINL